MKSIFLSAFVFSFFVSANAQTHVYQFSGSLNETSSIGPALTETLSCGAAPGSYITQVLTIPSGFCGSQPEQVFAFNEGGGLSYPNNSFITGSYTIHLFFEFNALAGGYQRIIDFKNSTTDRGMYILATCLNFYPNGNVGTCPFFEPNKYYLISIVRDATTNLVNVYVNGALFVTDYNDATGDYAPATPTTPVIFFRDDNAVTCEDKDGTIKYLSLKATTSTPAEVATVFANICAIVLPLRLTGFTATKVQGENKTDLQWNTENEINTEAFIVERSTDGINFEAVKNVPAMFGTRNQYHYTDNIVASVPVYYYRLKMTDRDGKFTYSNILRITNAANNVLSVSPNPAHGIVSVGGLQKKGTLLLYNAEGKLVARQNVSSQSITLDMGSLPAGIYLLKYVVNDVVQHTRIVKE